MKKPYLSILIPTYNREEKLARCLAHLREQSLNEKDFEIIVVNDGSKDGTKSFLDKMAKNWSQLHVIHQKNQGQGIARNAALRKAKGEIVLFIGDDIYATPDFLQRHVDFHKSHPHDKYACLGLTKWWPKAKITPYMHWLTHGGPQFAYHKIKGDWASFWFFYTSNISLKKQVLKKHPFDLEFEGYGWEDIELGYRLQKKVDLQIRYLPEALAHHDHFMEPKDLKKRMTGIAKNGARFHEKHPELGVLPKGLKRFLLKCIASRPSRCVLRCLSKRLYWYALSKHYFLQGICKL